MGSILPEPPLKTDHQTLTPSQFRHLCRTGSFTSPTAGICPGAIQANLLILPSRYAADFLLFCERNPVPCPLLAYSATPGDPYRLRRMQGVPDLIVEGNGDFDIRTDLPGYNVYREGVLVVTKGDVLDEWKFGNSTTTKGNTKINNNTKEATALAGEEPQEESHTAFLIGCSFTFETALMAASTPSAPLIPRHITAGSNVPMYATNLPLAPAGIFTSGTWVVSMRPYPSNLIEHIRSITRPYRHMHGEPVAWGWDAVAKLGIRDINTPEWGDAVRIDRGKDEVPVFWGCGVTPQNVVMMMGDKVRGDVMAHVPGDMLVCDLGVETYLEEFNSV